MQRAARAAASSRGASERRELGFPLVVALVVILGIGLVLVARSSRDPLLPPRTDDHWHAAYTFYECGVELPQFTGVADPDGIHSHQDGLIHIHPFNSSATGDDATTSVFFEAMQVSVTDVAMEANEFGRIEAADGCDDGPAVIKAARWNPDGDDGMELVEVFERDFSSIGFDRDGEAFTFALVPVGEDPPEPSATTLAALANISGGALVSEGPVGLDDVSTSTLPPLDDAETEDPTEGEEPVEGEAPVEGEDPADDEDPVDTGTEGGEPAGDADPE